MHLQQPGSKKVCVYESVSVCVCVRQRDVEMKMLVCFILQSEEVVRVVLCTGC